MTKLLHYTTWRKSGYIVAMLIVILSGCARPATSVVASRKRFDLLITANAWKLIAEQGAATDPTRAALVRFSSDGFYKQENGDLTTEGTWRWTAVDEIYLQLRSLSNTTKTEYIPLLDNYYIKVDSIAMDLLYVRARAENDGWDFAVVRTYQASR